ncbi:DUF2391 domain-containing protein [Halobiforma lacisalsi AJ5]|uniref:DUF2391 domain-containing protein n=1 Tax=Natronobacterium lacisalsi AJ5 TaxID=358396 RepID=M0LR56_NATLA|nr:hypothetical protein [Halobiforma lacisalsi]APW99645.1 DUF2391 domain-containing protein [Halobiforma lacisalsi AJ5]EMA35568.1 hypothetical protein C445_05028 [Halobiforma lacisalsi AJ5]
MSESEPESGTDRGADGPGDREGESRGEYALEEDDRDAVDVDDVLERLDELERSVSSPSERADVRSVRRMLERVPGGRSVSNGIQRYTTRDVAEGFVGGVLLSLPMVVEDGVFEIAAWFLEATVAGIPVALVANVTFIVLLTHGLLYWTDFRDVEVSRPLFGIVPRRLLGVLSVSFLTAVFLLVLWGRHAAGDPTPLEFFARATIVWAAAAVGASLGDILPGESEGTEVALESVGMGEDD